MWLLFIVSMKYFYTVMCTYTHAGSAHGYHHSCFHVCTQIHFVSLCVCAYKYLIAYHLSSYSNLVALDTG